MPSFSLRSPYTIIVGALVIIILGVTAYMRMPVDVFPTIKINSVIVLENINRHLADGEEPAVAVHQGVEEVSLSVLAITLTTCIVFFPVMFLVGVAKYLFSALAVVLFIAASYVIAMTVIPIYCARFLTPMARSRTLLFFACLALLVSGCAQAAQKSSKSAAQAAGNPVVAGQYWSFPASGAPPRTDSAAAQQIASPATSAASIPPGAEMTLKQAISIALKYHPRIREAAENTNAAAARISEARSFLGPQVYGVAEDLGTSDNGIADTSYYNVSGMYPRITGRNHSLPSGDFTQTWDTNNNYMGGLAMSQFLFDFGRQRGFVAQRRFEAASVAATEQLAKLDLIFEVSQRYFNVLQAKQLIGVYEKAVEQRQFHLHEAQVKAEAALRPELDVYVTQAEVERAQLHLVDARNAYDDAKVALNNALGLSDRAPEYHLADVLTYSPVKERLHALLRIAIHQRPDLIALDNQAKALGAQIVEYRSDYFPTANALGGYSAMGTGPAMGYRLPVANNFNVGIVITWPIFNSFLTTSQLDETKARQRAVQDAIEDLQQRVMLEVQTAFLDRQAALERIRRAEKALAASRAQLELAEKRYEAGLTNIVELEDAQRYYTYDDAAYAGALYGFSVANAAVDRATGRSLSQL